MTLYISKPQYHRMQEALETVYPQEGCGILVGKRVFEAVAADPQTPPSPPSPSQESHREVVQIIPVVNAWEAGLLEETEGKADPHESNDSHRGDSHDLPNPHGAHDRYWIAPADLLRIQQEARDQGLEIIGIFHSHPNHPAEPSECDRRLAWPVYSYVIASVNGGQVAEVQSWRLNPDQQFEPEKICLIDEGCSRSEDEP